MEAHNGSEPLPKNVQISMLVQQLKAGVISKEELFDKLKRLQRGEVVVSANGSSSSSSGAAAVTSSAQRTVEIDTVPSGHTSFAQVRDVAALHHWIIAVLGTLAGPPVLAAPPGLHIDAVPTAPCLLRVTHR